MSNVAKIVMLLAAVVVMAGCVTTSKGPQPPDLSEAVDRISKTERDLTRIRASIESDIESLRTSSGRFFGADPGLYRRPFPLDLFRHTAMACLNTPIDARDDVLPAWVEAADEAGLTCAVAPTRTLLDRLNAEVPVRQPEALKRLELLDTWRGSRGRMQDRLRQLPRIVEQTRDWIARQRATTRQTELELQRRRTEYSADRFEASTDALEEHRQRLTGLEERVDKLAEAMPAWSQAVAAEIDYVYSRLSLLSPP